MVGPSEELSLAVVSALAGGAGFWGFLTVFAKLRRSPPADIAQSYAAFAAAVNLQAQHLIDGLAKRVDDLEAANADCVAEGRRLRQRIDSLERQLIANGIPLPARNPSDALVVMEDGQTTVAQPRRKRRAAE